MPQIDLEALVAVCRVGSSGGKIACEPLDDDKDNIVEKTPESFLLSKHAEFYWFDRNAILERKDSTKRNATYHSNSSSRKGFSYRNNSSSSSKRFSKSKAALIGLPKAQKNIFCDKGRCKPTSVRLFPPKRSGSRVQMKEPSSPKVSCVGKVRSRRGRRRLESRQAKTEEKKTKLEKKKGFCAKLLALFRSDHRDRSIVKTKELSVKSKNKTSENSESTVKSEKVMLAPGLEGMSRFASGRRSYEAEMD